ncbi:MAG: insulinase family protein [Tannerella sp.]|nr:insulinase family protein [Tannerella sp.]
MHYFSHTLSNNLRIIHLPTKSPVAYCGFAINAGTRDEQPKEFGLAHFVEHMLFKGTTKRKSWHILNRMEYVGGELNAYTSKEETFVYSVFMTEDYERAIELITDLIVNSKFPPNEIEKEREVILDEIQSYEDSPSELIFDEFENVLFNGHPLGHHILGNKRSLLTFTPDSGRSFIEQYYTAGNMVFFSMGEIDFKRIIRLAEKYLATIPHNMPASQRNKPEFTTPRQLIKKKKTHQSHVIIGAKAYDMHNKKRVPLFLLNNLLGGPGMNSRLNVSLREKHGLVYNVESNITSYTDTGFYSIYYGTDPKNRQKTYDLIEKELANLRNKQLSTHQLTAAKKQAIGQMVVASDNKEGVFLGLGKSFLHYNKYDSLPEIFRKVEAVTAEQIQDVANEVFAPESLFSMIYE